MSKPALSYEELYNLNQNLEKRIKFLEEKVMKLTSLEDGLRESEQRFRQLANSTFEGIVIHEHGKIIDANEQLLTLTGYSIDEVIGANLLDFVVLEYRKPVLLSIRSDSPQAYDTVFRSKRGENIEVEVISRPFSYKGRSVRVAAIHDLSYKKHFVKSIEESEEKFRQLAEHSTDAIVLMNQYMVLYTNASFDRIFGFPGKSLTGPVNYLQNIVHHSDKKFFNETINSSYFKTEHRFEVQYRIVRPDGSIRWIWNRCFPIYNAEGTWIRQVMLISDITNQKLLENDLYKSKAQLQAILDNIPYWAWLKDNKGKYVMVNQPFADNFHTTTDWIIDKTDFDLYPRELAHKFEESDKEVARVKKRILFQEVDDHAGELKWSETFKTPIFNEAHEIIGITGIARDITNRKKSELALKFSEEKYKELVTLLPEMVFETDVLGNVTFLNLRGFELFEYTNDDFSNGINLFDMLAPEDVSRAKINMSRIFDGMKVRGEEYTAITKTGKSIPVMIYADALTSENKISGLRGVMVDSSDRKIAEDREKKYHRNLIFLSNTALNFLTFSTDDDNFIFIGKKITELVKNAVVVVSSYNEQENNFSVRFISGVHRHLNSILNLLRKNPEDLKVRITKDFKKKLLENELSFYEVTGGLHKATFGSIPFETAHSLEKLLKLNRIYAMGLLRGGNIYGSVIIATRNNQEIRDIKIIETFLFQASISLHKKQLENELIRAKEKAEESDRLKSAFLANMSHEIRTPMNGILGMTQLLANPDILAEQRREYVELINKNSETLLNLIDDIIDVSKIEAGQMKIMLKGFRLNSIFDQLSVLFKSSMTFKNKEGIKLIPVTTLPDNLIIISDPDRLRQVLINLVGNAIKFTEKGFVEFGYSLKDYDLEFYVRDSGIGISKEKLKVIFDRFTQADDSLTRKFGGSGLGLTISKGLIELLGGRLWASSVPGEGSTFYFTIPYQAATEDENQENKPQTPKSEYNWTGRTFLIVEDDKVSFKFLEGVFKKTGVTILHADNGLKAIDFCRSHPELDIVLMDIQLPEMSGLDATRVITSFRKDLPIIAQTANAMSEDKEKCLEVGCIDYVSKPINIHLLFNKIDKYLGEKISLS